LKPGSIAALASLKTFVRACEQAPLGCAGKVKRSVQTAKNYVVAWPQARIHGDIKGDNDSVFDCYLLAESNAYIGIMAEGLSAASQQKDLLVRNVSRSAKIRARLGGPCDLFRRHS